MSKLTRMVDRLLKESGLPYEIRPGKKHHKVFIRGRMCFVLSHGTGRRFDDLQAKSYIEKARNAPA